jgi:hypothetical protein
LVLPAIGLIITGFILMHGIHKGAPAHDLAGLSLANTLFGWGLVLYLRKKLDAAVGRYYFSWGGTLLLNIFYLQHTINDVYRDRGIKRFGLAF